MATIDVTKLPATVIEIYFDRVEDRDIPGWRCKNCRVEFADTIPFGPPPPHDCPALLCAWCPDGNEKPGSHGICPRHFMETI